MFLVMHYNNRSKAKTPEADKKRSKIKHKKKPEGCVIFPVFSFFSFFHSLQDSLMGCFVSVILNHLY